MKKRGYTCFVVPGMVFDVLYHLYDNPAYPVRYGHHITEKFNVLDIDGSEMTTERRSGVVALTDLYRNSEFEVFTATIDGKTHREDGKPYHLTWAKAAGCMKGPVCSVEAIDDVLFVSAVDFTFTADFTFTYFD